MRYTATVRVTGRPCGLPRPRTGGMSRSAYENPRQLLIRQSGF